MTNLKYSLILVICFLTGLVSVLGYRLYQVNKTPAKIFNSSPAKLELELPSQAIQGEVILIKGKIEILTRDSEEFKLASASAWLVQGERLRTQKNSQTEIKLKDIALVKLSQLTEIVLVNLIPGQLLVSQTEGKAEYKILETTGTMTVRSPNSIIEITQAEATIEVNNDQVTVQLTKGEAKIALVDLNNDTQVYQLKSGQTALINEGERRVRLK